MSTVFYEMAKKNYAAGLWTLTMLKRFVQLGRITAAEYTDITGEPYER